MNPSVDFSAFGLSMVIVADLNASIGDCCLKNGAERFGFGFGWKKDEMGGFLISQYYFSSPRLILTEDVTSRQSAKDRHRRRMMAVIAQCGWAVPERQKEETQICGLLYLARSLTNQQRKSPVDGTGTEAEPELEGMWCVARSSIRSSSSLMASSDRASPLCGKDPTVREISGDL
ncbi:hypothetical protein PV05_04782 [Exophiala xenobiotica]|uniref:Uncharacterized protein n=1 Tax=Exophiala xenobiotica TaxID=348802 RepID=A0A0D2F7T8_9EURO|nr:uncharacterized protein PV05_04782 [Exophiala xenobiotica]KIW56099.1 hypothetical protein PV05_04782 [Exophiala xenobiotica]